MTFIRERTQYLYSYYVAGCHWHW